MIDYFHEFEVQVVVLGRHLEQQLQHRRHLMEVVALAIQRRPLVVNNHM